MSIYSSRPLIGADENEEADGTVLVYGSSTKFPDPADLSTDIELASIPAWCVPGHAEAEDSTDVAEYLRLRVEDSDVVLTDAAALKLYHQLGNWLMTPKRKAVTDA
ncbi:hypothetical protein [Microbacterium sp. NPDC089696]|uniref:hypothetical protein n=1 Tax=Microbacterium sp. NPDC089696 TaxID=3364199 RepID=UPI0037F5201D